MSIYGFDIGSESSKIVVAKRGGIEAVQNEVGNRKTPSYVSFYGQERKLGEDAMANINQNYRNTGSNFVRMLGRPYSKSVVEREQSFMHCKLVDNDGFIGYQVDYNGKTQTFSPEAMTAMMLQRLKLTVERTQKCVNPQVVIAVPPYFTDVQRRAMLQAAEIAGVQCLRIINSMAAVALTYGILRKLPEGESRNVMFFDMGASATSVSIVQFQAGRLEVKATVSDETLGGRDVTKALYDIMAKQVQDEYKMDVKENARAQRKLWKEANKSKMVLSANTERIWQIEYLMNDKDCKGRVTREELEKAVADTMETKLNALLERAYAEAKVESDAISAFEMVGGGCRVPIVQSVLKTVFNGTLSTTCDGDESVAKGCALMCAMLSPVFKVRDFEVKDASPYSVSLSWGPVPGDDVDEKNWVFDAVTELFKVNNPIPSIKLISFKNKVEPFQIVARYTSPDSLPASTEPMLCRFIVDGFDKLPELPDGITPEELKVKVKVRLNKDGVVAVKNAQVVRTYTVEEEVVVQPQEADKGGPQSMDTDDAQKEEGTADKPEGDAAGGEAPAETEGEGEGDKAPDATAEPRKEVKQVRKTDKQPLRVKTVSYGGLTFEQLQSATRAESNMVARDLAIIATNDAKNALESYALEMCSRLGDDYDLEPYMEEKSREAFRDQLRAIEDWLYDEGDEAEKKVYEEKLAAAKKEGDTVEARKWEWDHREEAVKRLKTAADQWVAWTKTTDEKFAHITEEERGTVRDTAVGASQWATEHLAKAALVAKHEPVTLSCSDVEKKVRSMNDANNKIYTKKKPEPETPPPAEDAQSTEGGEGESKQEDGAAAEGGDGDAQGGAAKMEDGEAEPQTEQPTAETDGNPQSPMDVD